MSARLLVVEDEDAMRRVLRELLSRAGHDVIEAATSADALRLLYSGRPELVLLDVGLPDMDGWTLLGRIRELSDVPVLMLTGKDSEPDKVRGLQAGADDFVTKPFGRQQLLARIDALLRRAGDAAPPDDERYEDDRISVDHRQRLALVGGEELRLTPLEFRLLAAFTRHAGQVLSHEQLLDLVWSGPAPGREQVKLNVAALRRKLRDAGLEGDVVETVRGFGYRYRRPV